MFGELKQEFGFNKKFLNVRFLVMNQFCYTSVNKSVYFMISNVFEIVLFY